MTRLLTTLSLTLAAWGAVAVAPAAAQGTLPTVVTNYRPPTATTVSYLQPVPVAPTVTYYQQPQPAVTYYQQPQPAVSYYQAAHGRLFSPSRGCLCCAAGPLLVLRPGRHGTGGGQHQLLLSARSLPAARLR